MPNITVTKYNQLLQDSKHLEDLIEQNSIRDFCSEFSKSLGILATHTPRNKWPKEFKLAFEHCAKGAPTAAQIYLKRHQQCYEQ